MGVKKGAARSGLALLTIWEALCLIVVLWAIGDHLLRPGIGGLDGIGNPIDPHLVIGLLAVVGGCLGFLAHRGIGWVAEGFSQKD